MRGWVCVYLCVHMSASVCVCTRVLCVCACMLAYMQTGRCRKARCALAVVAHFWRLSLHTCSCSPVLPGKVGGVFVLLG